MKKSTCLLLTAICFLSVLFIHCEAQTDMSSSGDLTVNKLATLSASSGRTGENVNSKAEKNFSKSYQQATAVEWSALQDKSWVCRFNMNNIFYKAYYNGKGQWLGTVSSYDGSKLNKGIRDQIKSTYYDYKIGFVSEVNLSPDRIIYIVEIQDEKSIKKIRIASDEDEMEVVQEIEKY
jgi:hypothetical protein